MTFSIPDLSDPAKRAMLPPSQHKTTAGLMLQGCADIQDPLAIKHILAAVYLHTYTTFPNVRDTALLFPKSAIQQYRQTLATLQLAGNPDPEALTLHGQFLEQENRPADARALYERALQLPWIYAYNVRARHPAQLPVPAPWIALGALLKAAPDASASAAAARAAFELGAEKGDDPLAWYELSLFHAERGAHWLKCVSKAAASGHREAMLQVARFYRDLSAGGIALEAKGGALKAALDWLLGWRAGGAPGAARLAEEWFEAAGGAGHKGAMLELADWCEARGRGDEARRLLGRIVEPDESGKDEEFAAAVHQAKGRLSGVRTK